MAKFQSENAIVNCQHTIHQHQHHFGWDNTIEPVLSVAPGQTIEIETIDAKSKNGELPSRIVFTCSPYHELPTQQYMLRMSMLTGGTAIRFKVSVICMEDHEEETTKNFENELTKIMPENVGIFIGTFKAGS